MTPDEEAEYRRLRWRCRRGMRELDRLLERYMERRWANAEPSERALFERLLDCEDDQLWRWFLQRPHPEDAEPSPLVEIIIATAAD